MKGYGGAVMPSALATGLISLILQVSKMPVIYYCSFYPPKGN